MFFENKSILITGGTGSLGKSLVLDLLKNTNSRRIIIFSRDELKQSNFRGEIGENPRLRWFIGDIRDRDRLKRALFGVDYVIHAAALKQVDTGEYNPMEFIKTNVIGSSNLIEACIDSGVSKVVALSTDKVRLTIASRLSFMSPIFRAFSISPPTCLWSSSLALMRSISGTTNSGGFVV